MKLFRWILPLLLLNLFVIPLFSQKAEDDEKKKLSKREKIRERMRGYYDRRVDETGKIPDGALLKAKKYIDRKRLLEKTKPRKSMDAGIWNWTQLGPGNIGGRIRALLIHPTSTNTMWVGSVSGGIWKTTNGGSSWSVCDDFMANLAVTSLVMDPNNHSVLYASTGEGLGGSDALQGAGVFKSTDGGDTWNQLSSTISSNYYYVNRLAHHPDSSGVLYLVTDNNTVEKTTNGGSSWTTLLNTSSNAVDIKIHPTNPDRIMVGTSQDVHFSNDAGLTWSLETAGGSNDLPSTSGRCEVAFAESNDDVWYVSIDRNGGEVWRTTDACTTWNRRNTGENYFGDNQQGWYDNAIWVDPTNSNFIVVGGIDLYRSSDGGATLDKFSNWQCYPDCFSGSSAHADQHIIVHHPNFDGNSNTRLFVGNDGGIQRIDDVYNDGQYQWTNLANSLSITQFYYGAVSDDGELVVGGAQDNANPRFEDGSGINGWEYVPDHGDGFVVAVHATDPDIVYAESYFLNFARSDNGGASYSYETHGLDDAEDPALADFNSPFTMDPNDPDVVVAGGSSIWKTTNKGNDWTSIKSRLSDTSFCRAIDIAPTNSNVIWVGYRNGRVSKTTNGGSSWTTVTGGSMPSRTVTDIAINPDNSSQVFVTFGGYTNSDNIWYTSDGGTNWSLRVGSGDDSIPPIQVNTITFHPTQTDWVYVGTDLGIFASEDKGQTWSTNSRYSENEGPVNVEVDHLFWEEGSQYLYAATHGRGMWKSKIFVTVFINKDSPMPFEDGSVIYPYKTVEDGYDAAGHGSTLLIEGQTYNEAPITLKKRLGKLLINNGPVIIK